MKINIKQPRVMRTKQFQESSFGIKKENLNVLFDILRNKMYSDKMLAIIREYSVNALDAHIDSGIPNKQILVNLPTNYDHSFSVRDFGEGLTERDVREIYCMYGSSTKRQSNKVTGQLGLGSKSAFSYTDSFVIISYNKGVKKTYNAYIDETNIGKISLINTEDSKESDGICIQIPIKIRDVDDFLKKAKQVFFHFKIKPIIKNYDDFYRDNNNKKIILSGKNWTIYKHSLDNVYRGFQRSRDDNNDDNKPLAVMGNVAYPINPSSITNISPVVRTILNHRIEINFEIGDLEISASRESLEYGNNTCKSIQNKCVEISKDIIKESEEQLQKSKTLWDAKIFCKDLWGNLEGFRDTILKNNLLKWRGIPVNNSAYQMHSIRDYLTNTCGIDKKEANELQMFQIGLNHNNNISRSEVSSFTAEKRFKICIRDTSVDKWIIKSKQILDSGDKKALLVFINTNKIINRKMSEGILKAIGMWEDDLQESEKNWLYLSEVEIKKVQKSVNGTTITNPKNSAKIFKLKNANNLGRYQHVFSDYWDTVNVDKTKASIFVEISHFKLMINGYSMKPIYLNNILEDIKNLNLNFDLPKIEDIYGIKSRYVNKFIDNKWKKIENVIEEKLKNYLNSEDILDHSINREVYLYHSNSTYEKYLNKIKEFKNEESLFIKYLKRIHVLNKKIDLNKSNKASKINQIMKTLNKDNDNPKENIKNKLKILNDLEKTVLEKYPMLSYIGYWKSIANEKDVKNIINYINLMETI